MPIHSITLFADSIPSANAIADRSQVQRYRLRRKSLIITAIVIAVCSTVRIGVLTFLIINEAVQDQSHQCVIQKGAMGLCCVHVDYRLLEMEGVEMRF